MYRLTRCRKKPKVIGKIRQRVREEVGTLKALKMARTDAGLTISELAERAGVSRDTISNAEKGRHGLQATTLHKLARALGRTPSELLAEEERLAPEAPRLSSLEPTLFQDGLEEKRRARWGAAVGNARRVREGGRARMEELLSAWRENKEKERGEDPRARHGLLLKMGQLLQEAFDARSGLLANLQAGWAARGAPAAAERAGEWVPNLEWEEVREADGFYWALRETVEGAGLYIRTRSARVGEAAQAGQPEVHKVEELKAA
jgi:transcriptional regulator with XRE-family HTH domain